MTAYWLVGGGIAAASTMATAMWMRRNKKPANSAPAPEAPNKA